MSFIVSNHRKHNERNSVITAALKNYLKHDQKNTKHMTYQASMLKRCDSSCLTPEWEHPFSFVLEIGISFLLNIAIVIVVSMMPWLKFMSGNNFLSVAILPIFGGPF